MTKIFNLRIVYVFSLAVILLSEQAFAQIIFEPTYETSNRIVYQTTEKNLNRSAQTRELYSVLYKASELFDCTYEPFIVIGEFVLAKTMDGTESAITRRKISRHAYDARLSYTYGACHQAEQRVYALQMVKTFSAESNRKWVADLKRVQVNHFGSAP